MHLKQRGFTCSACGPFTKNKERIEKFMQTRNTDFTYKNDLDNACFEHDMTYGKSKDLIRRTKSDKVLKDKAFETASDPKYDGCQRGLASMVYNVFDKRSAGSVVATLANKSNVNCVPNYQLVNELHKQSIKKFKRRIVCSSFKDNILDSELDDTQSLSKYSTGIGYLLCAIDLFSKYAWVVPLKDIRGISIVNAFQKMLDSSKSSKAKFKELKSDKI